MHLAYVRELKPYSIAGLAGEFGMDAARTLHIVEELMTRGIVRYRVDKTADGVDATEVEGAKDDELYQFNFVGMAMVGDLVVIAYPKFFRGGVPSLDELRQIMRVLKRDAGRASVATLADEGERTDDKLPVMLALLELYAEYGVYSNFVEGRELNGAGAIDWNRTIGNHLPILADGRPVYVEYETRKTLRDESDFITRLHRAVLTECSKQLFGADEIRALGTTSFFHLWEEACKTAFGDALDTKLGKLDFPLKGEWVERKRDTLLGIIESPKWERRRGDDYIECDPVATLIPDTISFAVDEGGRRAFCIYDAKYYVPSVGGKIERQPGLESVTKQFLYQSAYKDFVLDHGFDYVVNAFLVPTASDKLHELARVSFPKVMGEVEPPFSNYIHMWALPAGEVFDAYLRGERIDVGAMRAIWEDASAMIS